MNNFFVFDNLTWPEVAELPRDTPLLIPCGSGYDPMFINNALGNPAAIGMLPPIPYGWPGSGLAVPEEIFSTLLGNLVNSLADDGFSQVYALTPQGMALDPSIRRLICAHPSQYRRRIQLAG